MTIYRLKGGPWDTMLSRLSIKYSSNLTFKLSNTNIRYKVSRLSRNLWANNEKKLSNNISRAKTTIYDYAINNDFYFFVTLTTNKNKIDRYNLKKLISIINEKIKWLRRKTGRNYQYLLIPESHKNGAWHLHGFFSYDFAYDFYVNDYLYLSWSSFDNIGFSSISIIDNYTACCKYITKYVNKEFSNRKKGDRLYFCSKGLKRSKKIYDFVMNGDLDSLKWSYIGDYGKTLSCNEDYLDYFFNNYSNQIYDII